MSTGSDWGGRSDDVVHHSMLGWVVVTARLNNTWEFCKDGSIDRGGMVQVKNWVR